MKKYMMFLIFIAIGVFAYNKYQANHAAEEALNNPNNRPLSNYYLDNPSNALTSNFTCNGRTYCSEMTSCEEATFFLKNCPDVKMDGNNDGVPCETQWCR